MILGTLLVFMNRTHTHKNWLEALCRWVGLLSMVFMVEWSSSAISLGNLWCHKLDFLPAWSDPQRMLSRSCSWHVPGSQHSESWVGKERWRTQDAILGFLISPVFSGVPRLLGSGAPHPETLSCTLSRAQPSVSRHARALEPNCCPRAPPGLAPSSPAAACCPSSRPL